MRAAKVLQQGGLIAHQTATLAGVAAHPKQPRAIKKLQRFKQRQGPFLLLAASLKVALSQARYITPALRKLAKKSWPGPVTLVYPAKKNHAKLCYQQGLMAVRVDADDESCRLAKMCGGLILSSSLNRRAQPLLTMNQKVLRRFSSWIDASLSSQDQSLSQAPSRIYRLQASRLTCLR